MIIVVSQNGMSDVMYDGYGLFVTNKNPENIEEETVVIKNAHIYYDVYTGLLAREIRDHIRHIFDKNFRTEQDRKRMVLEYVYVAKVEEKMLEALEPVKEKKVVKKTTTRKSSGK